VEELEGALGELDRYLASTPAEPLLLACALAHYQFEVIHPFIDGNGRIGRILVTLFLKERALLAQPLLYLSEFFDRHKDEYYRRLLLSGRKGDFSGWFEFFLGGVAHQARAALADAKKILALQSEYQTALARTKKIRGLPAPDRRGFFQPGDLGGRPLPEVETALQLGEEGGFAAGRDRHPAGDHRQEARPPLRGAQTDEAAHRARGLSS